MKTKKYIINTYKGNLLESVKRFQNAHKNVKILEAVEDGNKLKITTETAINEDSTFNLNKAKSRLASGGEKLRNALKKLFDALGSHGDIHGALEYEDFSDEEKELIEEFFKDVQPKAWNYSWTPDPTDKSFTDEDSANFEKIYNLVYSSGKKKFLFIFKWNNNYEWGEGSVEADDLESAKSAFAKEMEFDSYKEFDNDYSVYEILQIPTQSVKKVL